MFFRRKKASYQWGLSVDLEAIKISPAVLNTRSDGTLVSGMANSDRANAAIIGYWDSFFFHQSRGRLLTGKAPMLLYFWICSSASSTGCFCSTVVSATIKFFFNQKRREARWPFCLFLDRILSRFWPLWDLVLLVLKGKEAVVERARVWILFSLCFDSILGNGSVYSSAALFAICVNTTIF